MSFRLGRRIGSFILAAGLLAGLPLAAHSVAPTPVRADTTASTIPSDAEIRRLAGEAYIWGLGPQFTWRFAKYNTTISAPVNAFTYGMSPAAWNNSATNAGDSSIIYINGFMDFTKASALVLTVPPSANQYYVVNYLDNYINTIGSIGTRTTPSTTTTSYLLVGPNSPFAKRKTVKIGGKVMPVMASDTNLNWMLIRILASTMADSDAPDSTSSVYNNVSKKFAINTLGEYRKNGYKPVYPTNYSYPPPTDAQIAKAAPFKNLPKDARRFFTQLGNSLVLSPIPRSNTGLGGTPVSKLPSYVVPQYGAKALYFPPAYGQSRTLDRFAPIGLTAQGFKVPKGWGPRQLLALQAGYEAGQKFLNDTIAAQSAGADTNYWTIINDMIGTYPNTVEGYFFRSTIVLNGGSANIPLDAVYPSMTSNSNGLLDGNQTYAITFTPPQPGAPLPVVGIFPPQVTDSQNKPKGFWSITLYQPDASEVSAPFLTQASVLNTAYSSADTQVLSVNPTADTITVTAPTWGKLVASTPLLFSGLGVNGCGITTSPYGVYYVAANPVVGTGPNGVTTYTFPLSAKWQQDLSEENVPVQYSGQAGTTLDITCSTPAGLNWGMVKPVSQLGSSELEDGRLQLNNDGSLTIWIGPTLPGGAPATNWIPTPSNAYNNYVYPGETVNTALQVILRSYYPMPGNNPPSLLPYPPQNLAESYIPPALETQP